MDRGRLRGHRQLTRLAVPHLDNRMIIVRSGQTTEEVLGDQTNGSPGTRPRQLPAATVGRRLYHVVPGERDRTPRRW